MSSRKSLWLKWQLAHDPCVYCGRRFRNMTIDHIVPKRLGASREYMAHNSAVSCMWCNEGKGHRSLLRFMMTKKIGKAYSCRPGRQ